MEVKQKQKLLFIPNLNILTIAQPPYTITYLANGHLIINIFPIERVQQELVYSRYSTA